jgi:hypothetical protein
MLGRQVLYHLLNVRATWTVVLLFVLLHITRMTGIYHHAQPLVEMGSCELFAWSDSKHDPLNLYLWSS